MEWILATGSIMESGAHSIIHWRIPPSPNHDPPPQATARSKMISTRLKEETLNDLEAARKEDAVKVRVPSNRT